MTHLVSVHDRLKEILSPYRDSLVATKDGPAGLTLEVPGFESKPWGYVALHDRGAAFRSPDHT